MTPVQSLAVQLADEQARHTATQAELDEAYRKIDRLESQALDARRLIDLAALEEAS